MIRNWIILLFAFVCFLFYQIVSIHTSFMDVAVPVLFVLIIVLVLMRSPR